MWCIFLSLCFYEVSARFDRYNITAPNNVETPRNVAQNCLLINKTRFENSSKFHTSPNSNNSVTSVPSSG